MAQGKFFQIKKDPGWFVSRKEPVETETEDTRIGNTSWEFLKGEAATGQEHGKDCPPVKGEGTGMNKEKNGRKKQFRYKGGREGVYQPNERKEIQWGF